MLPRSTSRARAVLAASVLLVLAGIVAVVVIGRDDAIDDAIEIVEDDSAFTRADDAGAAFVRISTVLRRGAERCEAEREPRDARCDAMFAGSAYAQVAAVTVLECTRPGIFEARETMRDYLRKLRDAPDTQVPNLRRCEPGEPG